MVKIAFSAALLGSCALADMQQISENFQKILENSTQAERTFGSGWASSYIESINHYGCWCYFQGDHGKGRGLPTNGVDEACKVLSDGYSCVLMDFDNDPDCIPWEVEYNSGNGLGLAATDPDSGSVESALRRSCSRANRKNNCGAKACMVESMFVLELFKMFLSGSQLDMSLKHSEGFVPKDMCRRNSGPTTANPDGVTTASPDGMTTTAPESVGPVERACCGEYPRRYPYKLMTNGGQKDCCGQNTYNIMHLTCCAGNEIKVSCD